MCKGLLPVLLAAAVLCCSLVHSATTHSRRRSEERNKKSILSDCRMDVNNATFSLVLECVRDKSLLYLDKVTAADTITLFGSDTVKLVRRKNGTRYKISNGCLFSSLMDLSIN